jgi:peptide-methionine (S)-S-oxide reductase
MFFLSDMLNKRLHLPKPEDALPGRAKPIRTAVRHHVSKRPLRGPYRQGLETVVFGMGNFHDAERLFWQAEGVWVTASGFAGGMTANPTCQEVLTGLTGHAQVVLVVFDPAILYHAGLLELFWEAHDPTQGMRQGADIGTPYRSAIYTRSDALYRAALASREAYQRVLRDAGLGKITTEIASAREFFFAEAEHQQYLSRNPRSPAGLKGTGVSFEIPAVAPARGHRGAGNSRRQDSG